MKKLQFFLFLNLGLFLTAIGIAIFKTPNHFAFGGTSGISIILATLFPKYNVGNFMWLVNGILVVLGLVFLGRKTMGWTIYSSFALSFYVSLIEKVWILTSPLTNDTFLKLKLSMTVSTNVHFKTIPKIQYKPVFGPKR